MAHSGDNTYPPEKGEKASAEGGAVKAQSSSGLSSGLQPSGTLPGGGPGAGVGSIGTGGGSTAGTGTGNAK